MKKGIFLMFIIFMVFVCFPLSISNSCFAFSGKPIKMAALLPLTGTAASPGQNAQKGIELAIHDLNAKGGIKGRQVIGDFFDGRGDKTQSSSLVRKIADDKEYIAILGPVRSPVAIACSSVADQMKMLLISVGSISEWPGEFNKWTFRTAFPSTIALPLLVKEIKKRLDVKTAAIIYAFDDDYTISEMKINRKACDEVGIRITDVVSYRTGDTDFKAQLTKIKSSQPDLLLVAALPQESGLIMGQAREVGVTARFAGGGALGDTVYYKISGGAAEKTLYAASFNPKSEKKVVKDYIALYRKYFKTDAEPTVHVAWSWDGVKVLANAIERAPEYTREAVRDALGKTKDFEGICGVFSYDNCGDAIKTEATMLEMKGGVYVLWK